MIVKCKSQFIPDDMPSENFKLLTEEQKSEYSHWHDFYFDLSSLESFNESTDGNVTIRLKSGYACIIQVKLNVIEGLFGGTLIEI